MVLSDYDQYQLSKYFPGKYTPRCTYAPSGEMTAAVSTKNGYTLSQCTTPNAATNIDLGTNDYTVIAYCPALSHLNVSSTFTSSTIAGKQPSGLVCYQTDTPSQNYLQLSHFFGYTAISGGGDEPTPTGMTSVGTQRILNMKEVYGFESDTSVEKFVYSGKITFKFVVPAANLTGTMYKGKLRVGQLQGTFPASAPASPHNGIRLEELITIADKVQAASPSFDLESALVNDYILSETGPTANNANGTSVSGTGFDQNIGSEWIHYVVLQRPAVNITTGANMQFSLIGEVQANSAVLPTTKDLLLFRTFQTSWLGKQKKYIDFQYKGPLEETAPPRNYRDVERFANNLPELGEDNGPELMPSEVQMAQSPHPLLLKADSLSSMEEIKEPAITESVFTSRHQGAVHRELEYFACHYIDIMKEKISLHKSGKLKIPYASAVAALGTGLQLITSTLLKHGPGAGRAIEAYDKAWNRGDGKLSAIEAAIKALRHDVNASKSMQKMEGVVDPSVSKKQHYKEQKAPPKNKKGKAKGQPKANKKK